MSRQQTIQRSPHNKENPYVSILRTTAQDKNLSYEARGLLAYLLSKPLDWKVQIHELQHEDYAGRDKVQRIIKELAAAGYITRPKKYQDKKGKWCWTSYYVWEEPQYEPLTENPLTDNPALDSRHTDEPSTENTSSYKGQNHKEKTTKERYKRETTPQIPLIEQDTPIGRITNQAFTQYGTIVAEDSQILEMLLTDYTEEQITTTMPLAKGKQRPVKYLAATLKNQRLEGKFKNAPAPNSAPPPSPQPESGYIVFDEFPGHSRTKGATTP